MDITWETDVMALIPTEEIISKTIDMQDEIDTKLQTRIETLQTQQSSGLSSDVLLDGTASFYNESNTIIDKYTNVEETLDGVVTGICNATVNQNIEELDKLKKAVEDKLDELEFDINDITTAVNSKITEISNLPLKTVAKTVGAVVGTAVATAAKTVTNYVVNVTISSTGLGPIYNTVYNIWSIGTQASAISDLKNKFFGEDGSVTKLTNLKKELNQKLEDIETRRSQLEGYSDNKDAWKTMEPTGANNNNGGNKTAAGDGQETDDENMTTKVGVNYETDENGDPVIYYDKETKEVFYKDKDGVYKEIPVVPGGVAGKLTINASTGTFYKIDIDNMSADVVIDGKKYTIPVENAKDIDTTKGAHIDASGDTVFKGYGDGAPISDSLKTAAEDIQTATEEGSVANPTDATEDVDVATPTDATEDVDVATPTDATEDHTGGGAGHKFDVLSDYTPSIEVKDSTNQTIQLYSNKADDDLYYKDSNGDMKKAIKIGQEYVINAVSYTEK